MRSATRGESVRRAHRERRAELPGLMATEVAVLTGATRRMLGYWKERGLLVPSIEIADHKYGRLYSEMDTRKAAILTGLSRLGVELEQCRDAMGEPIPVEAMFLVVTRYTWYWVQTTFDLPSEAFRGAMAVVPIPRTFPIQ